MPVARLTDRLEFPPVEQAEADGLVAIGGDLTVGRLLEAYRRGIFPWFEPGEPILWWSPDPRLILEPDRLQVSRSLRAVIRKETYETRFDTAFAEVIEACAATPRKEEPGTWIGQDVKRAYASLHEHGYAHSVESWKDEELVGGLYGVCLGQCFFGESMFSRRPDASKVALAALCRRLQEWNVHLIDCQVTTGHLRSLGAEEIPRSVFLNRLEIALRSPTRTERWTETSAAR